MSSCTPCSAFVKCLNYFTVPYRHSALKSPPMFRRALLYDRSSLPVGELTTEAGFLCGDFTGLLSG